MERTHVTRADIEAMIEAREPLSLLDADVSGEDLSGLDLSGARLRGANFSGANLTGAMFWGADLSNANLSGANLAGAILIDANFIGANLTRADLTAADLRSADLSGANATGANLTRATLGYAIVREANFHNARLTYADFSRALLTDADLSGAHLTGASLSRANLFGADLSGAHLTGAHLDSAILISADLTNANLTRAIFSYANLSEANLSSANLSGVKVHEVDLHGANLSGANLRFASLAPSSHNVSEKNLALLIALRVGTTAQIEALLSDPYIDPNAYHHAALWAALKQQVWPALDYLVSHPALSITDEQVAFLKALSIGDFTPAHQSLLDTPELQPYTGAAMQFAAYNGHLNAFAALAKLNDVLLSSDVFWVVMEHASPEILQFATAIFRNNPEVMDEVLDTGSPAAKAFLNSYAADPHIRAKTACVGFLFESGIPMSGEAMFALAEAAVRQGIGEAELAQLHQDGTLAPIIEQTFGSAAMAFSDIQKALQPLAVAWEVPPAFEIGLPRLVNYAAPTLSEWAALTAWRVLHEPIAPGASAHEATATRTQRWLGALAENALERIATPVAQERAHALQQQREEQLEQRRAQRQEERGAGWVIGRALGRLAQLDRDAATLDDTTLSKVARAARLVRTSLAEFRSAMNRHDTAEIRAACADLNRNSEKYEHAIARHLGSAQHARRVQLFGAIQDLTNMPVENLAAFDVSQQLANDAKAPQRTRSARNVQRTGLER